MKNRFIPETANRPPQPANDPDSYDASEEQFAASLEAESAAALQPFIVDKENPYENAQAGEPEAECPPVLQTTDATSSLADQAGAIVSDAAALQPALLPTDDAWRREVSARLSRYRSRKRARTPRYPSLQLKFEAPAPPDPPPGEQPLVSSIAPTRLALAIDETIIHPDSVASEPSAEQETIEPETSRAESAKIIEFPRFFAAPAPPTNELAGPVATGPRILEVPEQMPPPPALGGILIEPEVDLTTERRAGFELPLNPPAMSRRVAAAVIDFAILAISFAAFTVMFYRTTHTIPAFKQCIGVAAALLAVLWMLYEYLFLVHAAATPGLRLTRLQLARFDGTLAPRPLRRWRVFASILSGLSLTLGYIWCFFDEDQLCWHDRITHTYMACEPGFEPHI
jgi:uncharacterized RDD family membrane protein YckC